MGIFMIKRIVKELSTNGLLHIPGDDIFLPQPAEKG